MVDRRVGNAKLHGNTPDRELERPLVFETERATVVDLLAYDDAGVVDQLRTKNLLGGLPPLTPKLKRLSIDRESGKVHQEQLTDVGFEFPQMDWALADGKSNVVYGAAIAPRGRQLASEIVSIELESSITRKFRDADWIFGEPIFVGKPQRTAQGDGVLLTEGTRENSSAMFVLDARSLEPLARADFPTALPLGFHGTFVRA